MFNEPLVQAAAAIIAGVLVLIMPRLLNYVVALGLILFGVYRLNEVYKFLPFAL